MLARVKPGRKSINIVCRLSALLLEFGIISIKLHTITGVM